MEALGGQKRKQWNFKIQVRRHHRAAAGGSVAVPEYEVWPDPCWCLAGTMLRLAPTRGHGRAHSPLDHRVSLGIPHSIRSVSVIYGADDSDYPRHGLHPDHERDRLLRFLYSGATDWIYT